MEFIGIVWIILGSTIGLTFFLMLFIIAGSDILMAFQRRFQRKGCDVYMANTNRNISHYYLTPKEGVFKIKKLPYITNPEKTMNLTEETKLRVTEYITKKEKRLGSRIIELQKKQEDIDNRYRRCKNQTQKFQLKAQYEHFDGLIIKFKDQLRNKQENYFKDKRPAFFYIENDPIPKDFYEFYSSLDSKIVDNLVSRAKSQPPNKKQETDIQTIKMLVVAAAIAASIGCYFAFRNQSSIAEICRAVGATCAL